jgi:hypothetical protein
MRYAGLQKLHHLLDSTRELLLECTVTRLHVGDEGLLFRVVSGPTTYATG